MVVIMMMMMMIVVVFCSLNKTVERFNKEEINSQKQPGVPLVEDFQNKRPSKRKKNDTKMSSTAQSTRLLNFLYSFFLSFSLFLPFPCVLSLAPEITFLLFFL